MSSSNRVRITSIPEVTYAVTPPSGNFSTARFTGESLSGTPSTTESQQIRSDRYGSGQIVTGLEVGGDLNFELAKEATFEQYLESVMYNSWNVQAPVTVDITVDADLMTLTRATGDWNTTLQVGDFFTTEDFANQENNTRFQVIAINSATVIKVIAKNSLIDEVGEDITYTRADRLAIGTTVKSFSMEKAFLDLTTKAIIYPGMIGNTFNLNIAYGELISGTIGFVGAGRIVADQASEFITNGRTINAAANTASMNGSIDMPFLSSSLAGVLADEDFCIQSLAINLDNNNQAQNCIGRIGPKGYSAGTGAVTVDLSTYLADDNWELTAKKLSQEPFALGFMVENADGGYGFYLPAVQVSFDDPSSGGANQEISMEASGTAKVGSNGESPLYIYRF
jgi:hypothetical protein